jgi:hypothetical protein
MSRAALILANDTVRERAVRWCQKLPQGTRVEFKEPKRTLDQNSRMWAILTDVSRQAEHNGRKYPPEIWKTIFLHALGRETQFIPSLDGQTFIPLGLSSSQLSKAEMGELFELIEAWCAQNGVELSREAA